MNLTDLKTNFLARYNKSNSVSEALSKAISAAVQHNSLYSKGVTNDERVAIRTYWSDQLIEIAQNRPAPNKEAYESQILELQELMTVRFPVPTFFSPNKSGVADGFRISHSQKSLSIFSKHLWCLNLIDEPVFCAVDAIILGKTDAPSNIKWTKISTIEAHKESYKYIETKASKSGVSIAQWELNEFAVD
jgi:glycine cleavage system pyridoxal-binding protein P